MDNDNQIVFSKQIPLAPESKIGEYSIIKVLNQNGERITYLGQDEAGETQVKIEEFFPSNMAQRCEDEINIKPVDGCATKFKYFRASFLDLYRTLGQAKDNECLLPILQILELNGTVYAVLEYREMMTLEEYLQHQGGQEDWCRAKSYLLPLYNSLSNLHKKGITHQGICPQNILLDEQISPFWDGFALSEMRTVQGEIQTELFEGYSAPEQYQLESWQGTWTDVYSMAAVTYRVLTGQTPPSAQERRVRDRMYGAAELNADIEQNVSEALWEAMELDTSKRYDSIDMLTEKLLQTVSSNTAVFRVEDTQTKTWESHSVKTEPQETEPERKSHSRAYAAVTMLATLVVLVFAAPALYRYLSSSWEAFSRDFQSHQTLEIPSQIQVEEPEEDYSHVVENFVGQKADTVINDEKYASWYFFETEERYDSKFDKGIIIGQSVSSGNVISHKMALILYVSKGPESSPLPALEGKTQEEAVEILNQMGKQYRIVEGENPDNEPGTVFRTEPPAGTMLNKESSSQVILYVVKEKPPKEEKPQEKDEKPGKRVIHRKEKE